MTISIGDKLPSVTLKVLGEEGPQDLTTDDLFKDKRVVLFGVPGAFTPGCSKAHLPGFVVHADEILAKGVDQIACVAVNDPFVMQAWGEQQGVPSGLRMLSDGNGDFTRALGLEMDATAFGMGLRSKRFALYAEDGVVKHLFVEAPGEFRVSSAEHVLGAL